MQIVVLDDYSNECETEALVIAKGHSTGSAIFAVEQVDAMVDRFSAYDGCLVVGEAPEFEEFARSFHTLGKMVWRRVEDIPYAGPIH